MSSTSKNQETVWNYLWNYIASNGDAAKTPERPSHHPRTMSRSTSKRVKKAPVALADSGAVNITWVSSIQLSMWDNISGPRVEQVWVVAEEVKEDLQLYAARHTLCGVLTQQDSEALIEIKFHVNADQGYMVTSAIFSAPYAGSTSKFSLCLIIKHNLINMYLILHNIIVDRMTQLVYKLKAMLDKVPEGGMLRFTQELAKFCNTVQSLFNPIPPTYLLGNTVFVNVQDNQDFIARAITSHLQTHGSTVVTGSNEQAVNMYIETLALFLAPRERKRVSLAGKEYIPDMLLQGIVGPDVKLLDDKLIENMLPTTWIDVDTHHVKHTHLFHEYGVLRKEFIYLEVDKLVGTINPGEQKLWSARDGLFRHLKAPSDIVKRLLVEMYDTRLRPELREGYISQAVRLIIRKALVLIKYVEAEVADSTTLGEGVVKKIRTDMGLISDADFYLLLAFAEKLKPGSYITLAGDPTTIEEKFIELFEAF